MKHTQKTHATEKNRIWYMVGLAMGFAGILITSYMAFDSRHHIPTWEIDIFHALNNLPQALYPIAITVTVVMGSVWMALSSVLIATLAKAYQLAWRLAAVIVGGYGIDFVLKESIDRGRPEEMIAEIHKRSVETGAGFPSGHTTVATVIALVLLPYLPKPWRWVVIVWIVAVALSRLYLGVHLPLDVIGAVFIGVFVVSFTRVMPQKLKTLLRLP